MSLAGTAQRWNWVKVIVATLAAAQLGAMDCGAATPAADELAWRQKALQQGEAFANESDLRVTRSFSSDNAVQFDFEIVHLPADQKAEVAIVVPDAPYTGGTVTLYRSSIFSPEIVSSSEVAPTFDQIGFVRGNKIGRTSFTMTNVAPLDPVVSGTLRLQFGDAASKNTDKDRAWVDRESSGPIRGALERFVANPADLNRFLVQSPSAIPGKPATAWNPAILSSPLCLRVPIDRNGLYQLSGADLISSGVSIAGVRSSDLRLVLEGKPQPILLLPDVTGGESGIVTAQTRWIFNGFQNSSLYTTTNTYWLISDPSMPPTWMQKAAQPSATEPAERAQVFPDVRVIREENPPVLTKNDQFLTILGFHWAWWTWTEGRGAVPQPTPFKKAREITFDLPGLYVSGGSVKASAFFYPHTWPSNQRPITVRVQINDAAPVELRIENATDEQKDFELPASALRETANKATLELLDADTTPSQESRRQSLELCFERLQINYQRLYKPEPGIYQFKSPVATADGNSTPTSRVVEYTFAGVPQSRRTVIVDATDSATKYIQTESTADGLKLRVREQGVRTYLMAEAEQIPHAALLPYKPVTDLHAAEASGDYLIISHPLFLKDVDSFAREKSMQGHAVKIINIDDIYDQFGAGQQTPHAIRACIRHATTHWKGSALAPAATYVLFVGDSSSAYRDEFRNGVINYVPSMTVGESGDRYASDLWFVTAFGEDLLADNFLGRISVNNVQDLQSVLRKQSDYAKHPGAGPWRNTLAYVADHSDFERPVENVMAETVPSRFFLNRIFMSEQPWIDNYYFPLEIAEAKKSKVSPKTTAKIRDMFNSGAAMVTYFGHGSPNVWSNERIWFGGDSENSDNRMLTNHDKLAFVVNMTCNSGAIDYPMPRWNICISEDFMRITNGGAVACYVPSGPGITAQHEHFTLQLNRALLEERVAPLGPALALANWRYLLHGNPPDLARMFILLGDPTLQLQLAPPLDRTVALDEPIQGFAQRISIADKLLATSPITTVTSNLSAVLAANKTAPSVVDFMAQNANGSIGSVAIPMGDIPVLSLVKSERRPAGLVQPGQQVQFAFTIKNSSPLPARGAVLEVASGNEELGKSAPTDILPQQETAVLVSCKATTGLARLRVIAKTANGSVPVTADEPIVLLSTARTNIPSKSILVDRDSMETRYQKSGGGHSAQIGFRAYNVSGEPLNSIVAGLSRPGGDVVTSAPVSSIAPGAGSLVNLTLPMEADAPPQQLSILLTSGTLRLEQPEPLSVHVSSDDLPDLAILPNGITVSSLSPSDGETVFFDVQIANLGKSIADAVRLEGFQGDTTSESQRMESRVTNPQAPFSMEPGTSRTVQVRWDPFHDAGPQRVRFHIASTSSADRNPGNDSQAIDLRVRTKAKVRPAIIKILNPTPEDREKKQIRLVATVRNEGESDAQGIRIVFYPTPNRVPKDAMGDVIIDVLPAGSSRDGVLVYKLKPGEETFRFLPSCETMLKGSLQRTPLTPDR